MSDLTTVEYYGGFITEKGIIKNCKKGNNLNIYITFIYTDKISDKIILYKS